MAVKLIASDLDGTLLRNDKSISEETGKALEKAREAGIYFVPSTGRALEARYFLFSPTIPLEVPYQRSIPWHIHWHSTSSQAMKKPPGK